MAVSRHLEFIELTLLRDDIQREARAALEGNAGEERMRERERDAFSHCSFLVRPPPPPCGMMFAPEANTQSRRGSAHR